MLWQPLIVTPLVTLLHYSDPTAHKITLQLLSHTVYCRVTDSQSPKHTSLKAGKTERLLLSLSLKEDPWLSEADNRYQSSGSTATA